jgi:hypothetical protein
VIEQAIIVFAEDSSVKAIRQGALGRSHRVAKALFLYSQRKGILMWAIIISRTSTPSVTIGFLDQPNNLKLARFDLLLWKITIELEPSI